MVAAQPTPSFQLPLDANSDSTCNIPKQSALAQLLITARVILWDEFFMGSRYLLEALNRTLGDLIESPTAILGNKIFIGGGDKRQILPVVPHGGEADILNVTVPRSALWQHFRILSITLNMRVLRGEATPLQASWASFLLSIGDGVAQEDERGLVDVPFGNRASTIADLIDAVYDDLDAHIASSDPLLRPACNSRSDQHLREGHKQVSRGSLHH